MPLMHVVLVEPEIHWNTGNAGRTCLALGAQLHLIQPLGFALDDRAVRRAGLDYWPNVQPVVWTGWDAFSATLPTLGQPYFFTGQSTRAHWEVSYAQPAVLIFGRESVGLSAQILAAYPHDQVAIRMQPGSVRSLNLSTAVAVAGYEAMRQWSAGRAPPT